MSPKIFVIIPVFNVELYLARFINTLLNQTFTDFELICVNDGSSDKSADILQASEKDQRIKLFHQENKGAAAAHNKGLTEATGDYISFADADADDMLEPQTLEIAYKVIKKYDAQLVIYDWKHNAEASPNPTLFELEKLVPTLHNNPVLSGSLTVSLWNKLLKKELLADCYFIEGMFHDDLPFVYEVLAKRSKTVFINAAFYLYTDNPNSITCTTKTLASITNHQRGLDRIYEIFSQVGYKQELKAVKHYLMPCTLLYELSRCLEAPNKEEQSTMLQAFSAQLHHWKQLKMFGLLETICLTKGRHYAKVSILAYLKCLSLMLRYPDRNTNKS